MFLTPSHFLFFLLIAQSAIRVLSKQTGGFLDVSGFRRHSSRYPGSGRLEDRGVSQEPDNPPVSNDESGSVGVPRIKIEAAGEAFYVSFHKGRELWDHQLRAIEQFFSVPNSAAAHHSVRPLEISSEVHHSGKAAQEVLISDADWTVDQARKIIHVIRLGFHDSTYFLTKKYGCANLDRLASHATFEEAANVEAWKLSAKGNEEAIYTNLLNPKAGFWVAADNYKNRDKSKTKIYWSDFFFFTWSRACRLDQAPMSGLRTVWRKCVVNKVTRRIMDIGSQRYPGPSVFDKFRCFDYHRHPDVFLAFLGSANVEGVVRALTDHAGEFAGTSNRPLILREICQRESNLKLKIGPVSWTDLQLLKSSETKHRASLDELAKRFLDPIWRKNWLFNFQGPLS